MRVNTHDLLFRQHCPICEKELFDLKSYSFIEKIWGCKNKCYVVIMPLFGLSEYFVEIFDYKMKLEFNGAGYPDFSQIHEIEHLVEYWRKDQLYLTKIMGVD